MNPVVLENVLLLAIALAGLSVGILHWKLQKLRSSEILPESDASPPAAEMSPVLYCHVCGKPAVTSGQPAAVAGYFLADRRCAACSGGTGRST